MKITCRVVLLITAFSIFACAHSTKETDDLLSSVRLEWDAKVKDDWGTVYDLTAGSFKEKMSGEDFLKGKKIAVISYEILEAVPSGMNQATAIVKYSVKQEGQVFEFTSKEEWLLENGQWRLNLLPNFNIPESK